MLSTWFGLQSRSVSEAGSTYALLDGTSDKNLTVSSENFNFSGSTDEPFSIIGWADGSGQSNGDQLSIFSRSDSSESPYSLRLVKTSGYLYLEFSVYSSGRSNSLIARTSVGEGWHQFAVTYSGNRLISGVDLYMDGVAIPFSTISNALSSMYTGITPNQIGGYMSSYGKGKVKDIAVFNIKLTANQITEAYNNRAFKDYRSSSFAANVLGYWSLNNTLGSIIGGPALTATEVDYIDVVNTATAYLSTSGNDGTAVIDDNTNPFLTINAALTAIKALSAKSGIIEDISGGVYDVPSAVNHIDNVHYKGTSWGAFDSESTPTRCQSGTVFRGNFAIRNSNHRITDIAIDVGSYWTDTFNSGTKVDAISVAGYQDGSGNYIGYTVGTYIKNVRCLCYSPTVDFHALLLEHSVNPYFESVLAVYGVHGVVYKTFGGLGVNIECRGNGQNGMIIKSDIFNPNTKNVTVNGYKYRQLSSSTGIDIRVQSQFSGQGDIIENVLITNSDFDDFGGQDHVSTSGTINNLEITDLQGTDYNAFNRELIAYWKMNESSGDRVDSSGNGFTLTDVNTVPSITGLIGNAASLGTNKTLTNATVGNFPKAVTINFWIKATSSPTPGQNFFIRFGTFGFTWTSGDKLTYFFTVDGSTYTYVVTTNVLSVDTWYMVTVTQYKSNTAFYLNGSSIQTAGMTAPLAYNSGQTFNMGKYTGDAANIPAAFEEVSFFGRALKSSEITTLYNSGAGYEIPLT